MKKFSLLIKTLLFSNIKVGKVKNIRKKFILTFIFNFVIYLGFGIIYSLNVYSNIKVFNSYDYNYISNNYLDSTFAFTTLLSLFLSIVLVYSQTIYNKTDAFLSYPIKGNDLFFAKLISGCSSCLSIIFFPLLMNSFVIAAINHTKINLYSYFSSTLFSLSQFIIYIFLFSLIIVYFDSKFHLSTNKIFSTCFTLLFSILAGLVFIYFVFTSSSFLSSDGYLDTSKLDNILRTFNFLSFFGILHKESMLLNSIASYFIMPVSLILLSIIVILLNKYTKKHYFDVMMYPNQELKLKKKKNINIKEEKVFSPKLFELKRELKLFLPLSIYSFFLSIISLSSLIIFVTLVTSGIFDFLSNNLNVMLASIAILTSTYFPSLAFNAYSVEGTNLYFLMTIPNKKINIFKSKIYTINLIYIPYSIIIATIITWLFKLPIGMYFVNIFLSLSYLFSSNCLNYFLGLIKPNLNFTKNDLVAQKPMFILSELVSFILPIVFLIIFSFIFIPGFENLEFLIYLLPIIASFIYVLLGFLFLYYGKEQYEQLMNGGKNL